MRGLMRRFKTAWYTWLIQAGENRIQELQSQAYAALNERQQAIDDVTRLRIRRIQAALDE